MKKIWLLFLLLLVLLAGCGEVNINVNEDGSGELDYKIYSNQFFTKAQLEQEINKSLEKVNRNAGRDVGTLKKVKEKDGSIQALIEFDSLSAMDDDFLLVPLNDLYRYKSYLLEDLISTKGKQKFSLKQLDRYKNYPAVYLTGLESEIQTKVTLPNDVIFVSGASLVDGKKNQVLVQGSSATIVYKPTSGFPVSIIVSLIIAVIGFGLWRNREFLKTKVGAFR